MKRFHQFIEDTTTSAVPGAGDDSSTVVVRKKHDRKNKRKDMVDILQRIMGKTSKKS